MHDLSDTELDDRIRSGITKLVDQAPEPKPMPSIEPQSDRLRQRSLVAAAAVVAAMLGIGAYIATGWESGQTSATDSVPNDSVPNEGVDNAVAPEGRLYLLPPLGTDLTAGVDYSTDPNVDEGSAIIVGRPTSTGFDSIVTISHLTTGPTFGTEQGKDVTIAGRVFRQANRRIGYVAERLPDSSWLEYLTAADDAVLAEVAAATTFTDGYIHFNQTDGGIRKIGLIEDVSDQTAVRLSYPLPSDGAVAEPPVPWFFVIASGYTGVNTALVHGMFGSPLEQVEVRGQDGYIFAVDDTSLDYSGYPIGTGITWQSPSGHAVALITALPRDEALAFAEGLRPVDEETWLAELSSLDSE